MFKPQQIIQKDKLHDTLLKIVAEKTNLPLDTVDKALSFSFSEAKEAFHNAKTVEISGFGKYQIVKKRFKARLDRALAKREHWLKIVEQDPSKEPKYKIKLLNIEEEIKYLKSKENEVIGDI